MRNSLVGIVAGPGVVGVVTAILLAGMSYGQSPAPEKKTAEAQKPASAEQQKLPKGDELIDELIKALGGEATKKVTTRVSKGTFEQMGQKASITMYEAAPNKSVQIIDVPGTGKIEEGTNGEIFWRQMPGGAQLVTGEEAALAARHSDFYFPQGWRKYYTSAETVGTDAVDGHPAYKVVMKAKEGPEETWYIDEKTHLLDRMDLNLPGMGVIETYMEDYRNQNGVMIPFKVRQVLGGQQVVEMVFTSVEQNVEIPKDRFEPPAGLKEGAPAGGQGTQPPKPEKPEKPEKPVKP